MEKINFNPIEENTLNDKLVNLYGSHLVGLYTAVEPLFSNEKEVKPALPLLLELKVEDDGTYPYEKADVKVMIFGRETNNWNDFNNRKNCPYGTYNFNLKTNEDILNEIRGKHENLLPGEEEIVGIGDIYAGYCSYYEDNPDKTPFTERLEQLVDQLRNRLGDRSMETVWNNIYKIGCGGERKGKCCKQPTGRIKDIERSYFNVVAEEVRILKPDVAIFMTGFEADNAIKEKFNLTDDAFTPVCDDLFLHRIALPGVKYAARTIHPSHKGNTVIEKHYNAIIDDVLKHI